jgi:hypothetical protein
MAWRPGVRSSRAFGYESAQRGVVARWHFLRTDLFRGSIAIAMSACRGGNMSSQAWRSINLVLSAWLALSAFLWVHSVAHFHNAWTVAALAGAVALVGAVVRPVRALNTVLAAWLFFSGWALPAVNDATFRNNVIVAIVMFLVSIVGIAEQTFERPAGPGMR